MKNNLFFIFFSVSIFSFSQNKKNDLAFIAKHIPGEIISVNPLNTKTPIKTKHQNAIAKFNPVTLTFSGLMLFYQHIVSPQISSECIYTRSCSNFAKRAIYEYGIIKGVFLAADRLMRCNAFCENDFPSYTFSANGKIIDEPSVYKTR